MQRKRWGGEVERTRAGDYELPVNTFLVTRAGSLNTLVFGHSGWQTQARRYQTCHGHGPPGTGGVTRDVGSGTPHEGRRGARWRM